MAEHRLQLPDGASIHYQLEYRQRRTIGLKITAQGLIVHAPRRISLTELQSLLQQKSRWIMQKLAQRDAQALPPMQWVNGASLLYQGHEIRLNVLIGSGRQAVDLKGAQLCVTTPTLENSPLIARKVLQWYARQALPDFSRRVQLTASKLGESVSAVALSNARSRWGTCNSQRLIRLNWRLIQAPPEIIQYVVCHEIAHLREMNHSTRFYAILESLYPDHRFAEQTLKALSPALHRMA